MSKTFKVLLQGAVLTVALVLVAPFVAQAEFEDDAVIPKPDVIILTLKAVVPDTYQPVASVLAKGTDVTIMWQSDAKNGCYSNFKKGDTEMNGVMKLKATGSVTGKLLTSRTFTITCYGNSASKTATGRLTVGAPNLSVSGARIVSGLSPKFNSTGGRIANTYIGGGKIVLQATVKNSGNLELSAGTPVEFQFNGTAVVASKKTLSALPAGASQVVTYEHETGTNDGTEYQIQVCAGATAPKKCSAIGGKYKFTGQ